MFKAKFKNGAADLIAIVVAVVVVGALSIGITGNVSKEVKLSSDKGVSQVTSQTANLGKQAMKAGVPMNAGEGGNVGGSGDNYEECLHINKETVGASATYTGDIKCKDCGNILSKGNTIEVYVLSGTWLFANTLSLPQKSEIQQNILFSEPYSSADGDCEAMIITIEDGKTSLYHKYYEEYDEVYHTECVYSGCSWGWMHIGGSPEVYFGTEPQQVSKEFYEWFTANATQI